MDGWREEGRGDVARVGGAPFGGGSDVFGFSEDVDVKVGDLDGDEVGVDGVHVEVEHDFLLGGEDVADVLNVDVDERFGAHYENDDDGGD